jgi:hypothetical protein
MDERLGGCRAPRERQETQELLFDLLTKEDRAPFAADVAIQLVDERTNDGSLGSHGDVARVSIDTPENASRGRQDESLQGL